MKKMVAVMKAEGAAINGKTPAGRLGCSERSAYRYLGEVRAA
ncbi:hypothetical protein [Streptomyces cinnamoneus]|nr:hypothetical protein [Streptomyces cinnamoneus]